jgi:hypothetical protein
MIWVMLLDYCLTLATLAPSLVAMGPRAASTLCLGALGLPGR